MSQVLGLSDAVWIEIIRAVVPTLAALAVLLPVIVTCYREIKKMLKKVDNQTNGALTEANAKVERAEKILPSITQEHPARAEIRASMSVNDLSNNEPPKVTQNVIRIDKGAA